MSKLLALLFGLCLGCGGLPAAFAQPCPNPPPDLTPACPPAIPDPSTFLGDAYRDGLAEIQVSQLAAEKSGDPALRAFAQQMIDDHGAANQVIASLAQRKGIALPDALSDEQRALLTQLSSASGAGFDRLVSAFNVSVHERNVAAFHQQAAQANDPDVRSFAANNLPILETHLVLARLLADRFDPAAFLVHAYRNGLAEIRYAQIALEQATSADVKAFAQRMIDDHTRTGTQIQALAQVRNANLPNSLSSEQQAIADRLAQMSGADFDKAYLDVNVLAHFIAAYAFQVEASQGGDPDVKAFATDALPVLGEHFRQSVALGHLLKPSFLFAALQDGTFEVLASNLALLKSANQDVRSFAQQMIAEHGAQNARIAELSQSKSLGISDLLTPHQKLLFLEMMHMPQPAFDRLFMTFNIFAHQKSLADFKAAAAGEQDADIKRFAADAVPHLEEHLQLALQVAQGLPR